MTVTVPTAEEFAALAARVATLEAAGAGGGTTEPPPPPPPPRPTPDPVVPDPAPPVVVADGNFRNAQTGEVFTEVQEALRRAPTGSTIEVWPGETLVRDIYPNGAGQTSVTIRAKDPTRRTAIVGLGSFYKGLLNFSDTVPLDIAVIGVVLANAHNGDDACGIKLSNVNASLYLEDAGFEDCENGVQGRVRRFKAVRPRLRSCGYGGRSHGIYLYCKEPVEVTSPFIDACDHGSGLKLQAPSGTITDAFVSDYEVDPVTRKPDTTKDYAGTHALDLIGGKWTVVGGMSIDGTSGNRKAIRLADNNGGVTYAPLEVLIQRWVHWGRDNPTGMFSVELVQPLGPGGIRVEDSEWYLQDPSAEGPTQSGAIYTKDDVFLDKITYVRNILQHDPKKGYTVQALHAFYPSPVVPTTVIPPAAAAARIPKGPRNPFDRPLYWIGEAA